MNYTFKDLWQDRTLYWRLAWAILIPFTCFMLMILGYNVYMNKGLEKSNHKLRKEKYAFIENEYLIPFYKEKFQNAQQNKYYALMPENWESIAKKDSFNYIIEFKKGKDSLAHIQIWTNNKKGFDELKYKLQYLEAERHGFRALKIEDKPLSDNSKEQIDKFMENIGAIIHFVLAFFILLFAIFVNRYIAVDSVQKRGNNSFLQTLLYIFIPSFIAIVAVLLGAYQGINPSANLESGVLIQRYISMYFNFKYIVWILSISWVISLLFSSIWLWHNIQYEDNMYQILRRGNRYYFFIFYFIIIGSIASFIDSFWIKIIPILNFFSIGKSIINGNFPSIDIAIFIGSNIALSLIFLYWGKKKYYALD